MPKTSNSNVINRQNNVSKYNLRMIWICLENNLSDVEHERVRKAQEEDLRKRMLVEARLESRDRLKTRRIERQVVQFKAN